MPPTKYYDCHKHGVQVGDHCPHCVVHAYIPPPGYQEATCKGCYVLGTACGKCSKCADERRGLASVMGDGSRAAVPTHEEAMAYFRRQRLLHELGPLPLAPTGVPDDLTINLRRLALKYAPLAKTLDVLEQYSTETPEGRRSRDRVLRLALLEVSKQALVMQKVAEHVLAFNTVPLTLGALIERAEKEAEE